jgi:hypothetical protein
MEEDGHMSRPTLSTALAAVLAASVDGSARPALLAAHRANEARRNDRTPVIPFPRREPALEGAPENDPEPAA